MKLNRTNIFIAISSIALLLVLIIQVNWIFQTAKNKEELFNEKANIILASTTKALLDDKEICKNMEMGVGKSETHTIDSLLSHYMKFYNFRIDYSFEVIQSDLFMTKNRDGFINKSYPDQAGCYKNGLEAVTSKKGWELKLIFPEKKQFIIAEMGTLFITSVILILIVLVLFWRTTLSLITEKRISEHTTDFLNNMTHEFKTPLTNISLASKMMLKDSISKEGRVKHYSEIILSENEKLRLQVEQMLNMTAFERGEIPLRKEELDFHELIHDSLKCIGIQIENEQGSVKLNLNAVRFVVLGDKIHLTNALCNLIDNAIKYSREKPELSIQTSNSSQHLIIMVSDKGIGIEKEYQMKVFDKFFRVPTGNVHDVKGFGLGLAYVKKIVELHGGTIELQSEKGKCLSAGALANSGTTFTITLPNV